MKHNVRQSSPDIWTLLPDILSGKPEVTEVRLLKMRAAQPLQARIGNREAVKPMLDDVVSVARESGLPFWDLLVLRLPDTDEELQDDLIAKSLHHQSGGNWEFSVLRRDEVNRVRMEHLSSSLEPSQMYSLTSLVQCRDGDFHIPMLDFRVPPSAEVERVVARLLHASNMSGWLFESGRSYHFYGRDRFPVEDLNNFLGRALLFAPLVDQRWIAHQLIEQTCALRISRGGPKQIVPQLVCEI